MLIALPFLVPWAGPPLAVAGRATASVPASARPDATQQGAPSIELDRDVAAKAGETVEIGLRFDDGGQGISSLAFSIDYDARLLHFDAGDADGDGLPDGLRFTVPGAFGRGASFDAADQDGEIDVFVADLLPPLSALGSGTLVSLTFGIDPAASGQVARVAFSRAPPPSFGDQAGQRVPGASRDGSIQVEAAVARLYLPSLRQRIP